MRALVLLPLVLTACGPKAVMLPADPIQRAATCGIVAAAQARRASANVEAKLTLEDQGNILHYALLAGAAGGSFDQDRSAAVVNAMPGLGDKVTGGKWEGLIPECQAVFPATKPVQSVTLPGDPLQAQAGCHDLADFMTTALRQQEADYIERLRPIDTMERSLDASMGETVKARGLSQARAAEVRNKALAEVVKLGPPIAVLDQCVGRFGGSLD